MTNNPIDMVKLIIVRYNLMTNNPVDMVKLITCEIQFND
jgi:hypothetical protein